MKDLSKWLWFVPHHLREEIEGDLIYRYEKDLKTKNTLRAKLKLAWSIIRFFRPGILFRKNSHKKSPPVSMLKNYFVIAFRNLIAHKTNSGINILSLIIGITSALIMMTVVRYELSFDSFHSNADRIYRIYREGAAGFETRQPGIAYPVADAFREEVTSLENITAVQYYGGAQIDVELNGDVRKFNDALVAIADQQFLNVLDFNGAGFKWISGNREKSLTEPFTVVLTETAAKKYFGDVDPLGKTLRLEGQLDTKVTGVITDLPRNSDFPFTVLISYPTLYELNGESMKTDWNSVNADQQAFVLVPEGTSKYEVEAQFDKVHAAHVPKKQSDELKYRLQPLSEMHKDGRLKNFRYRTVDQTALLIMIITGLLLLTVGCINYINIATAQSTLRSREIGVRKVLGGQRKQLMLQFLSETFVLVSIACTVSLFLAEIGLIYLPSLTNMELTDHLFSDPFVLSVLGALIVLLTLMAGFYPAIIVSGFGIIGSLKGLIGNRASSSYLRKTLVVVQFAVTQAFLIGAFIVINQLQYSRNMDLGFDKDLVLNIHMPNNKKLSIDKLRDLVINKPSVSAIGIGSGLPAGQNRNHWYTDARRKETPKESGIGTEFQSIDTAFLKVYNIKVLAGRNFVNSDSLTGAIVNKTLASKLGFSSPEDAVGRPVVIDGDEYLVVGVCEDFHSASSREGVGNMSFIYRPNFFLMASVKLNANVEELQHTIVELEKTWSAVYPGMVFDYNFFDQNIENYYHQEKKLSATLQIFSSVFLVVACLGLYGLLSFVINRRMKEVAVRKVFGAGVTSIIRLISKDYVVLIIISFAIAAPASYYFMDKWLQRFTYHMPITWWVLVAPGVAALAVAMITLSGKLLKAASRNPADTLKYE